MTDMRKGPISIESDIRRGGATVFVIRVGDTDATRTKRFFELRLPDGSHSVRAEWRPDRSPDRPLRRKAFEFQLIVDGGEPHDVFFQDGELFEPDTDGSLFLRSDSFLNEASLRAAVEPFWVFEEADAERIRLIAPRFGIGDGFNTERVAADSVVTEWAGCEADFAGAGAGIGATAGFLGGGPKGAGAGAVLGGIAGAAFGLGYCTGQAFCG